MFLSSCTPSKSIGGLTAIPTEQAPLPMPLSWRYESDRSALVIENDTGMQEWAEFRKNRSQEVLLLIMDMKYVLLEEGITYIASDAFWGCVTLEKISLPDGLIHIQI